MHQLAALLPKDKAELNARLCAIELVSWHWNDKGVQAHLTHGRPSPSTEKLEIGVIAQEVAKNLLQFLPDVVIKDQFGNLMVNYSLLAEAAEFTLQELEPSYHEHDPGAPALATSLKKYYTDNQQLYATRLLALVKQYNQAINDASH